VFGILFISRPQVVEPTPERCWEVSASSCIDVGPIDRRSAAGHWRIQRKFGSSSWPRFSRFPQRKGGRFVVLVTRRFSANHRRIRRKFGTLCWPRPSRFRRAKAVHWSIVNPVEILDRRPDDSLLTTDGLAGVRLLHTGRAPATPLEGGQSERTNSSGSLFADSH
jgi:hypothetical protein